MLINSLAPSNIYYAIGDLCRYTRDVKFLFFSEIDYLYV